MIKEKNGISKSKNYDFVDTIRCISMMGIVFEHSTTLSWFNYSSFYTTLLQASVMQVLKFATIAFFLIAGFLINHKFTEYTPWQYTKNRFKKTIGPWAFWLHVLIIADIIKILVNHIKFKVEMPFSDNFLKFIGDKYYEAIFTTSFWFILNFLICICILLLFKKYIYSLVFGMVLGIISLFYSVNLYYDWIITTHTTALFGFVFYLWLGAYMNKHYDIVEAYIKKTSIYWFISLAVITFFFADLEIVHLKNLGIEDAYNTLRISNIIYSLIFFLLLLKIGPISFINDKLEPRKTTFGIYLVHQIILTHLITEILRHFNFDMGTITIYGAIGLSVLRFILAYGISMLLVKIIVRTNFRWSMGT